MSQAVLESGMNIASHPISITGRVLDAPNVVFGGAQGNVVCFFFFFIFYWSVNLLTFPASLPAMGLGT
jgi:hypothetical protein